MPRIAERGFAMARSGPAHRAPFQGGIRRRGAAEKRRIGDPRTMLRPTPVEIGDVIRGKYRLLRLLGDGGMGSVYEASHELLGTRVAIKVLHPELARKTGLVDRFLQEARVAA